MIFSLDAADSVTLPSDDGTWHVEAILEAPTNHSNLPKSWYELDAVRAIIPVLKTAKDAP